jgi:formate hydrogenlyase transcriptional activator
MGQGVVKHVDPWSRIGDFPGHCILGAPSRPFPGPGFHRPEAPSFGTSWRLALLRALQEREFERVGSNQPISVDVRLLAATNRDLKAAVANGSFREDLFYRLNVFPISVPSLRERADDIPLLMEYLVARSAKRAGKQIRHVEKTTLDLFKAYSWPGNIRELQNVI